MISTAPAALALSFLALVPAAVEVRLSGLQEHARADLDSRGIPHVRAASWPDAARVLGYLHARDRLFQMDLYRRRASGLLAEVLGERELDSDILVRTLGIRRSCEELWGSGAVPEPLRAEILAYAEGVNARIAECRRAGLPRELGKLGYEPGPWTPVDCLVFAKYMAWDQSGTLDDLWFGLLAEELGAERVEALWPLERPYEIPSVRRHRDRRKQAGVRLEPLPGAAAASRRALARWGRLIGGPDRGAFGSNNWALSGTRTASGKPLLLNDPHLGFSLPSIWYLCHLSAGGEELAGVTFPGTPVVIIGQNDHVAWGLTNMQADAVDVFVEMTDPEDPRRYRHRGEWKRMVRRLEEIPIKGGKIHRLEIDSTLHGPIIEREGRALALQWTGLGPTGEVVALWELSRARGLDGFLRACDRLEVPAMNVAFADREGHIALHPCGRLPLRLRGEGRIPMDGASGEHDWRGWIPREELPLAVDPPEGFVASANGRPAPVGYPHYLGWMWDPSYRTRRIHDMLRATRDATVESAAALQLDARDKAAEVFLPVFLQALREAGLEDAFERRVVEELAGWDFVGRPESLAPLVWLRWFDAYRSGVWDDEWESRGIERPAGSWGFTGDNRREPALEVLEYLTRADPRSVWFDDRRTAPRETRDDVVVASFQRTLKALRSELGEDLDRWRWARWNRLRIRALSGDPDGAREGGPVPGTSFTVNPGGDGGWVGGGASFRMIADLAHPERSLGIYPGGQSGDPASPWYADLVPLWAAGRYVPLRGETAGGVAAAEVLLFAP